MNSDCLSRPIPLRQPLVWRQLDAVLDRLRPLLRRLRAWQLQRAEYRRSAQAERDIARLSVRTLQDIGAPEGLIGQRRWQDECDAIRQSYWMNLRS